MRDLPRRTGDRERLYAEAAETFGAALRRLARAIAIIALRIALFLGAAWWNTHTADKLQDEIDALDAP